MIQMLPFLKLHKLINDIFKRHYTFNRIDSTSSYLPTLFNVKIFPIFIFIW